MIGSSILADTSILIEHLRNKNRILIIRFEAGVDIYTSSISLGELYHGAYNSANPEKKFQEIEDLKRVVIVLPMDDQTLREYGRIRTELMNKGKPIPTNDIWIAATARRHAMSLLTSDAHFQEVDGLLVLSE